MYNFIIDDLEYLTISGKARYDNSGEYDISYYENYIKENIKIIAELVHNSFNLINMIKDENVKKSFLYSLSKDLFSAYRINENKNPRTEYETSAFSESLNVGYFQSHKYAAFIEKDFHKIAKSYSKIINFMNKAYKYFTIMEKKGGVDCYTLYDIFKIARKACSDFGIHCPDATSFYKCITEDPYNDNNNELLDMDVRIDETDSLEHDILIDSLPYTVSAPAFTVEGPFRYELLVNDSKPKIWYNQSYLQKSQIHKK